MCGYVTTLKSSSLCYGLLFKLTFVIPTSIHPDSIPGNISPQVFMAKNQDTGITSTSDIRIKIQERHC